MAYSVVYAMDGMGFYHIPHLPFGNSKKEGHKTLITVEGGAISEEELVSHLARFFFDYGNKMFQPSAISYIRPYKSKKQSSIVNIL
jgi:hypothetical protein